MQQVTPRAGGDSVLGQHDREDDGSQYMMNQQSAHFDKASVPPSRHTKEEYMLRHDASFSQIESHMMREKETSVMYHEREEAY